MYLRKYLTTVSAIALFLSPTFAIAGAMDATDDGQAMVMSTGGYYGRAELTGAFPIYSNAYWLPPGFGGSDPQVFFDLSGGTAFAGTIAVGYDYGNEWRWDVSLTYMAEHDATGPWSHTEPATAGPHADISEASVQSTALMANVYYIPNINMSLGGAEPFLTAGVGVAQNILSDWTRDNAGERTFEGSTSTDLAWTVGAGLSWDVGTVGSNPMKLDVTYRYMDLGVVEGSSTPLGGGAEPVQGLTFRHNLHTVSVGLRMSF